MTRRVEETPTKLGLFRPLSTGSPGWVPSPWMSDARHLSDVAPGYNTRRALFAALGFAFVFRRRRRAFGGRHVTRYIRAKTWFDPPLRHNAARPGPRAFRKSADRDRAGGSVSGASHEGFPELLRALPPCAGAIVLRTVALGRVTRRRLLQLHYRREVTDSSGDDHTAEIGRAHV